MLGEKQLGLHGQIMAVKSTGPQEEARGERAGDDEWDD